MPAHIGTTFLACCCFQIARDKPYLQCKNEVSFDNRQLFYTERGEGLPSYQDFTPLGSRVSAGPRSAVSSLVQKGLELGSPSPQIRPSITLACCQRQGGQQCVCRKSLSRVLPTVTYGKEAEAWLQAWTGRQEQRFGFAVCRKEARRESVGLSVRESAALWAGWLWSVLAGGSTASPQGLQLSLLKHLSAVIKSNTYRYHCHGYSYFWLKVFVFFKNNHLLNLCLWG